ncbi:SulP family inorganic anion transporter [Vibrio sp. JC009]|uniref:SulP family inorganic anion transporter n=1 Tax=Vibrio sp. JC009 TaxID=2912314 RepID=UPI0023AF832E|nr:SulP family inorganic anion transporter [Vibrio sp. JC009]WED21231.1 SulP family inorganic anion transporter [Vibrio sp. JC009]
MFAILEAKHSGFLNQKYWLQNIISGVIVGVVALPLGMAFAIASGAKPEQGIYTSIVAGIMVSLFGGSRLQIAGPTGAFIVVLSGITAKYGIDGLQIATMMAGVILVCLGLARMGAVIKYIPAPVIIGFTSGIGVTIWIGQWRDFFGLPAISGEHFHQKILHLFSVLPQFDSTTTLLAGLSLFLVVFGGRIPGLSKVPGPLIALICGTLIQYFFEFESVRTIGSAFGGIPQGLPELSFPAFNDAHIIELIGPAFTIAMLGSIESLLSAVVADGMAGTKHNSNQELVGQGLANIAAPLFGGFAATGAIARTATNIRNGGNSPVSGIIHSVTLVLILLLLAPLAVHIPLATLSAILFVVAWNMSEARHFIRIVKQAPRADVSILLITFFLTVFADLVIAVNIGVILATLHFLRRMAASVEVKGGSDKGISRQLKYHGIEKLPEGLLVYAVDGPFFFAAVDQFEHALSVTQTELKTVVIDLQQVPFMDITAIQTLEDVIKQLKLKGITVRLSGANARVSKKLHKAGVLEQVGLENRFTELKAAVNAG